LHSSTTAIRACAGRFKEARVDSREIKGFEPVPDRPGRQARDLMGSAHGFEGLFLSENMMEPGSSIPLHTHTVEEGWVILEGELSFRLGDEVVQAGPGTVVRAPAGLPHAVVNDGSQTVRALTAAPWARDSFYKDATSYLEGQARTD
jgi:uncharacterized cupin superfamily protein